MTFTYIDDFLGFFAVKTKGPRDAAPSPPEALPVGGERRR